MSGQNALSFKGMGMLLRVIAVVGSSVATVISTWLPLLLFYEFSAAALLMLLVLLIIGAFLIHGLLTHVFNDITDFESGTDQFSPALLSGGSRVIQTGVMSLQMLKKMGLTAALLLALIAAVLAGAGQFELAILIKKQEGLGLIKGFDGVHIDSVFDEHAIICNEVFSRRVEVGDKVRIIPNHICPVSNLHETAYLIDNDEVVEEIDIDCRGKLK